MSESIKPVIDRCPESGCEWLANHDGCHSNDSRRNVLRTVSTKAFYKGQPSHEQSAEYCEACAPAHINRADCGDHRYVIAVSDPIDRTQGEGRWKRCAGSCYHNREQSMYAEVNWYRNHDHEGNPIYALGSSWEHNGYHDSDFYQCYYCPATGKIGRKEIGTTRFPGGVRDLQPLPEEHKPAAIAALTAMYVQRMIAAESSRINHPKVFHCEQHGTVELTKDSCNRARESVEVECYKCNGAGHWINPRNARDIRPCFGCSGSGKRKSSKAAKGQPMITRKAGTICKVKGHIENKSQYGTYSYGTRLKLESVDTKEVFYVDIANVKLHGLTVPTAEQVEPIARREAERLSPYGMFATSAISLV